MNPFTALPPVVRLYLYLVAFVVALVFAALEAADGDWGKAAGIFVASLVPLLSAGNTPVSLDGTPKPEEPEVSGNQPQPPPDDYGYRP